MQFDDPRDNPLDPLYSEKNELPLSGNQMQHLSTVIQRRFHQDAFPISTIPSGVTAEMNEALILEMQGHSELNLEQFVDRFGINSNSRVHVSEFPPHEFQKNITSSSIMYRESQYNPSYNKEGRIVYNTPSKNHVWYRRVHKPGSFWYSLGTYWLSVMAERPMYEAEEYLTTKPYLYEIRLRKETRFKRDRIFKVSSFLDYIDVLSKHAFPHNIVYRMEDELVAPPAEKSILDWEYFVRNYGGFELGVYPELDYDERYYAETLNINTRINSLYDFEIPSGVIWNKSLIKEFRFLGKCVLKDNPMHYEHYDNTNLHIFVPPDNEVQWRPMNLPTDESEKILRNVTAFPWPTRRGG